MPNITVSHAVAKEYSMVEAIKVLRTNIFFCGNNVKAIALTSCAPSEGKSIISLNLSASIAQSGKRVVLLDTDLRKSTLYSRIWTGGRRSGQVQGLSHYLSGMVGMEDILFTTDISNLYIIFAGALVTNADELLGSDVFVQLMQALKNTFDYIIVDTSPLGQVIDCAIMAPMLDRVALVMDANNNSYKIARRVKKQLESVGCKMLGVILNKVDYKEHGGYYGGYYRKYEKYGQSE